MGTVKPILTKRGFNVETDLMNRDFELMEVELTNIKIEHNTTSTIKHIPEIERQILIIK